MVLGLCIQAAEMEGITNGARSWESGLVARASRVQASLTSSPSFPSPFASPYPHLRRPQALTTTWANKQAAFIPVCKSHTQRPGRPHPTGVVCQVQIEF